MVYSWLRARRRQQWLREPISHQWRDILAKRVRHYQYLDVTKRAWLEGVVRVLTAEKEWVGGGGFVLTDEMKATIAGYAGVMTLGLPEPYYFDRLMTIIVYPRAFVPRSSRFDQHAPPLFGPGPLLGEAWHRGPVILSWSSIESQREPGRNLVIHEFSHHVDGLDGDVDGTPPMYDGERAAAWYRVTENEFERLRQDTGHGVATLLDRYGATNRAEFFAVASECFFERPRAMRQRHPELYGVLADFYCQDTSTWLPDDVAVAAEN
jgi:Mlc titration factor MtfA (ptsG expression regulator)